jgi:hypothetical protein
MTLAKVLLRLGALVMAIVGIGFLAVPVDWAAIVDIQLPTATARTDLRATYGGFDLAIGVYLWLCSRREDWIRPGLVALGLAAAGFGGGRVLGMLLEGAASPSMSALAAYLVLRRLP